MCGMGRRGSRRRKEKNVAEVEPRGTLSLGGSFIHQSACNRGGGSACLDLGASQGAALIYCVCCGGVNGGGCGGKGSGRGIW